MASELGLSPRDDDTPESPRDDVGRDGRLFKYPEWDEVATHHTLHVLIHTCMCARTHASTPSGTRSTHTLSLPRPPTHKYPEWDEDAAA